MGTEVASGPRWMSSIDRRTLDIEAGGVFLPVSLWVPRMPRAVVISLQPNVLDRLLPRDRGVLEDLCTSDFATLAVGLLTSSEESSGELARLHRFDISELAARTVKVIDWLTSQGLGVPIAILAKGTGTAAALVAAPRRSQVGALVSSAGRPDLAAASLPRVQTPTLLLVGAENVPSLHYNQIGADRMRCLCELRIIPGGGSLERSADAAIAAKHAIAWFEQHLLARKKVAPSWKLAAAQPEAHPEASCSMAAILEPEDA
jgi:putative phosphoribosyl transferase